MKGSRVGANELARENSVAIAPIRSSNPAVVVCVITDGRCKLENELKIRAFTNFDSEVPNKSPWPSGIHAPCRLQNCFFQVKLERKVK